MTAVTTNIADDMSTTPVPLSDTDLSTSSTGLINLLIATIIICLSGVDKHFLLQ